MPAASGDSIVLSAETADLYDVGFLPHSKNAGDKLRETDNEPQNIN
jgi:hypothetical protein